MASYFSHDSNARNSDRLIKVRMTLGAAGYGVYFMILERMREEKNYMSIKDYNIIAFDLRVDTSVVKKVVEDFGLFVFTEDGKYFYSESFLRRMEMKDEISRKKSKAGKKGAEKRWGEKENSKDNDNNIANAIKKNGSAIAEPKKNIASKVKKSKVKNNKDIIEQDSTVNFPFKDIINYLNKKADRNFKHNTASTKKYIKARFNEGFTLEDFKIVIDKKSTEWINTDMDKYLRPETLFSNKFESYLQQKERTKNQASKKPDTFGNFNQRYKGYSPEELDKIARRKFNSD